MSADLLTPPTTTTSPTLQMMSWHSSGDSFLPADNLKVDTVNSKRLRNGSGPEDRPPNVLRRAPAGRSLEVSQVGTCPE